MLLLVALHCYVNGHEHFMPFATALFVCVLLLLFSMEMKSDELSPDQD